MHALSRSRGSLARRCICSTPALWMPRLRKVDGVEQRAEPEVPSKPAPRWREDGAGSSGRANKGQQDLSSSRGDAVNGRGTYSRPQFREVRENGPSFQRTGKRRPRSERDAPPEEVPVIDQIAIQDPDTSRSGYGSDSRYTPRRRFNLAKLKVLSGWEKLDALNQFLSSNYLEEAIVTYRLIHRNGLLARVKYQDHHTMLRLLLSDPVEWRDDILLVWRQGFQEGLAGVGFVPTSNSYGAMVTCALRWGDRRFGEELFTEMVKRKVPFTTQACNHFLELFSSDVVVLSRFESASILPGEKSASDEQSSGEEAKRDNSPLRPKPTPPSARDLQVANELWQALKFEGGEKCIADPGAGATGEAQQPPVKENPNEIKIVPNTTTFTRGMELHGRLRDATSVRGIHRASISMLAILLDQEKSLMRRRAARADPRGRLPSKNEAGKSQPALYVELSLWNACMAALSEASDISSAFLVAKGTVEANGVVGGSDARLSGKEGTRWLNLLLKVTILASQSEATLGSDSIGAVNLADSAWKEAWKRQVDVDVVSYGRMIVLQGVRGDLTLAEEWYERAKDRLGLEEGHGSGKIMKLRTSLLQAYSEYTRRLSAASSVQPPGTGSSQEPALQKTGDREKLVEVGRKARELMEAMTWEADSVGKRPLRSSYVFAMEACSFAGDEEAARAFALQLRRGSGSSAR
ncbi:hypothetical protein HDU67_003945 [Dinochytrium kinnereticum]|nr:hypothetical protein HDU67_003945 [Dinochytrium kinnereticum]